MSVPVSTPPVLTLAQARQQIVAAGVTPSGNAADDVQVQLYIDAATRVVETLTGPILLEIRSRLFSGGNYAIALPWRPNANYDFVVVENTVTVTDYYLDAPNAVLCAGRFPGYRYWYPGNGMVSVTAWVGMDVVPPNIHLAVLEEFRFLWQLSKQGAKITGVDRAGQSADWIPSGFAIPHRVSELCSGSADLPGFA